MCLLNFFASMALVMANLQYCSSESMTHDGFLMGPDVGQPLSYYLRSGFVIDSDTKSQISLSVMSMPMIPMSANSLLPERSLASMSMPMTSMPMTITQVPIARSLASMSMPMTSMPMTSGPLLPERSLASMSMPMTSMPVNDDDDSFNDDKTY